MVELQQGLTSLECHFNVYQLCQVIVFSLETTLYDWNDSPY